jgi:hypothetical protein
MKVKSLVFVFAILGFGFARAGSELSAQAQGQEQGSVRTGLAGAWAFNEGNGTQIADSSGNGNTGTLSGNTSWKSVARQGAGLSFDGSGAWVQLPNSTALNIGGAAITVSFWTWIDPTAASDMMILGKPWSAGNLASPPYQYGVEFGRATRTANFDFGSPGGVSNGPFAIPLKTGRWTHIAFTYDGSFVGGFRDGAQVVSTPASGSIVPRGNPVEIGTDSAGAKRLKGQLDDLRIYSRALLAAEIESDMKTGVNAAADLTPPGSVVNLHRTDTHP